MKCKKCGEELPDRARFCLYCGEPVEREAEPAPAEDTSESEKPEAVEAESAPKAEDNTPVAESAEAPEDNTVAMPAASEEDPEKTRAYTIDVDDIPAPKKLEEPLEPVGVGAIPLVPVAPPPRATRIRPRSPRAYSAHGAHQAYPERLSVADAPSWAERRPSHAAPAPAKDADGDKAKDEATKNTKEETAKAGEKPEGSASSSTSPSAVAASLADGATELAGKAKERLSNVSIPKGSPFAVGALAVAAVLVVAFLAFFGTSWIGPWAPEPEPVPQVQPPSDGSIAPLEADDEEPEGEALPEDAPEVRSAVEDYSWQELSQISALISAASSDDAALELAERYSLCAAGGELDGTQTKDLELTDGTTVTMRVAGFRQDEKSDGSGKAGISLIAENPFATLALDADEDATSWEDTTLRAYFGNEFTELLPDDVADSIVEVTKTTNPVQGRGAQQVETDDKLWLPSYSELVGEVTSGNRRYGVYTSEGEQYQLFADLGVSCNDGGHAVALSDSYWWLRSPEVTNSRWFMCVSPDGITSYDHRPITPNSILIGFCL